MANPIKIPAQRFSRNESTKVTTGINKAAQVKNLLRPSLGFS